MTRNAPQSLSDFRSLGLSTLRAIYARSAAAVCKRDGISAAEFNADCEEKAANLRGAGFNRAEGMTTAALDDYLNGFTTRNYQTSPTTIEWGGGLSGDYFTTTERHPAAWTALMA